MHGLKRISCINSSQLVNMATQKILLSMLDLSLMLSPWPYSKILLDHSQLVSLQLLYHIMTPSSAV